jgi:RimJ/RimL family protein N-acetyltransferase
MPTAVQIRRYRPDDVDAITEAVLESKAELSRWMPWCHPGYCRQDAVTWVESRPNAWERNEEKGFVIVNSDGRLLGTCGIHHIDLRNQFGEIGYWVRSSATRQGVATEAVRRACQWAFEEGDLHRIEIVVSVENIASQRVAEKAGGVREGVLRERIPLHGRRHDCILFSILNRQ